MRSLVQKLPTQRNWCSWCVSGKVTRVEKQLEYSINIKYLGFKFDKQLNTLLNSLPIQFVCHRLFFWFFLASTNVPHTQLMLCVCDVRDGEKELKEELMGNKLDWKVAEECSQLLIKLEVQILNLD